MADVLSPVLQAASLAIRYLNDVENATDEQKRIRAQIKDCKDLIQQLEIQAHGSKKAKKAKKANENISALVVPKGPVTRLTEIFKTVTPKVGPGGKLDNMEWPFKKQQVEDLMSAIDDEIDLLALALHINSTRLAMKIAQTAERSEKLLRQLLSGIEEERGDSQRKEVLNWLSSMDDTALHDREYRSKCTQYTGEWMINSTYYKQFLKSKKGTLFCQGIPGAGKTFISSIVIDDLMKRAETDESVRVAYIYCANHRKDEKKAEDLLAYILKCLSTGKSPIPDDMKKLFAKCKDQGITIPPFDQIPNMLGASIAQYREVFVVVDAIDIMTDIARSSFLEHLCTLQKQHNLKIFATYRHIPKVTQEFENLFSMTIRAHPVDVGKYVDARERELPDFVREDTDLTTRTKKYIKKAADGMFLVAQRHFDLFTQKCSRHDYERALQISAKDSNVCDDIYNDICDRIGCQGTDRSQLAKKALSWVLHAQRPISADELQHALAVQVGQSEFNEKYIPHIDTVISSCFGMLTVDSEQEVVRLAHYSHSGQKVVRLAHYSLRKFLERKGKEYFPVDHTDMTSTCIAYLSLKGCGDGLCKDLHSIQERLEPYPFYEYAAHNWGHHARNATTGPDRTNGAQSTDPSQAGHGSNTDDPSSAILAFLKDNKKLSASNQVRFAAIPALQAYPKDMEFGAIHTAALFGLVKALEDLLQQNHDWNMKDWLGRTPLWVAAENGHSNVVKRLLQTPMATDALTEEDKSNEETPLSIAVRKGHTEVVGQLLTAQTNGIKKGLIPKSSCQDETACLPTAAFCGHPETVQLLLKRGAKPNEINHKKRTALFAAAYSGNEKILKKLLKRHDIKVCVKDVYLETPLWWAVSRQNTEAVRLLLKRSIDCINLQNSDLDTPLHEAAKHGNQTICELLLEEDSINPNLKNENGQTPLLMACKLMYENTLGSQSVGSSPPSRHATPTNKHGAVIKILVQKRVDVNIQDKERQSPLWLALYSLDAGVVKALMSRSDLNIECRNAGRLKPVAYLGSLLYDSSKAPEAIKILKLLLQHKDVDVNCKDAKGNTALHYASGKGDNHLVAFLKENDNLLLNRRNGEGRTPLSVAAELGFPGVVTQLLGTDKIKPNLADKTKRTPLSWATTHQTPDAKNVMKALLEKKGVNVNLKDEEGRSPLLYAAQHGNPMAVKILIEAKGVDVKAVDSNGNSAIQVAQNELKRATGLRKEGLKDIIQMLEDWMPMKEKTVRKEFEHRHRKE